MRNYRRSASGKEAIARYRLSEKGKARTERYLTSEKGRKTTSAHLRKRRDRNRAITIGAKSTPCADCSQKFDPICMDFHHISGDKKFNIGWGRYTPKTLLREIAKCIVLCSNCHRLRHKR